MKIAILTADENLYLPSFFARLLSGCDDIDTIYYTPPGHGKDKSKLGMVKKYFNAFGLINLLNLLIRIMYARLLDNLKLGTKDKGYSISGSAASHKISCQSIEDINSSEFIKKISDDRIDLIVSVSCPQIFKKDLINVAPLGCLNIHGAPLPKYRGLLPSFWMMKNGETKAAVTVFMVNEGIDSGDIVTTKYFNIKKDESLHKFILRSKKIHCDALLESIQEVDKSNLQLKTLDLIGGSYFGFPTRAAYIEFKENGCKLW